MLDIFTPEQIQDLSQRQYEPLADADMDTIYQDEALKGVLRAFYDREGYSGTFGGTAEAAPDDNALVDYWKNDMRQMDNNIAYSASELAKIEGGHYDPEQLQRLGYLRQRWDELPSLWESGGEKVAGTLGVVKGLVTDPTTYATLGIGNAAKPLVGRALNAALKGIVNRTVAREAGTLATKSAVNQAAKVGLTGAVGETKGPLLTRTLAAAARNPGAVSHGLAGMAASGLADTLAQGVNIGAGIQQDYSPGSLAASLALGALMPVAAKGVGIAAEKAGGIAQAASRALTGEAIPEVVAAPSRSIAQTVTGHRFNAPPESDKAAAFANDILSQDDVREPIERAARLQTEFVAESPAFREGVIGSDYGRTLAPGELAALIGREIGTPVQAGSPAEAAVSSRLRGGLLDDAGNVRDPAAGLDEAALAGTVDEPGPLAAFNRANVTAEQLYPSDPALGRAYLRAAEKTGVAMRNPDGSYDLSALRMRQKPLQTDGVNVEPAPVSYEGRAIPKPMTALPAEPLQSPIPYRGGDIPAPLEISETRAGNDLPFQNIAAEAPADFQSGPRGEYRLPRFRDRPIIPPEDIRRVQDEADRILGKGALNVIAVKRILTGLADNPEAWGKTDGADIIISLRAPDVLSVGRHEIMEAILSTGRLTAKEVSALYRKAGDWVKEFDIDDRYVGFTLQQRRVEAIAEKFAQMKRDGVKPTGVMAKVANTAERVMNAIRGAGFQTADDVLARIEAGKIAGRGEIGERLKGSGFSLPPRDLAASVQQPPDRGAFTLNNRGRPMIGPHNVNYLETEMAARGHDDKTTDGILRAISMPESAMDEASETILRQAGIGEGYAGTTEALDVLPGDIRDLAKISAQGGLLNEQQTRRGIAAMLDLGTKAYRLAKPVAAGVATPEQLADFVTTMRQTRAVQAYIGGVRTGQSRALALTSDPLYSGIERLERARQFQRQHLPDLARQADEMDRSAGVPPASGDVPIAETPKPADPIQRFENPEAFAKPITQGEILNAKRRAGESTRPTGLLGGGPKNESNEIMRIAKALQEAVEAGVPGRTPENLHGAVRDALRKLSAPPVADEPTLQRQAREIWQNFILSGLKTQALAATSGTLQTGILAANTLASSLAGQARRIGARAGLWKDDKIGPVLVRDVAKIVGSTFSPKSLRQGLEIAKQTLMKGDAAGYNLDHSAQSIGGYTPEALEQFRLPDVDPLAKQIRDRGALAGAASYALGRGRKAAQTAAHAIARNDRPQAVAGGIINAPTRRGLASMDMFFRHLGEQFDKQLQSYEFARAAESGGEIGAGKRYATFEDARKSLLEAMDSGAAPNAVSRAREAGARIPFQDTPGEFSRGVTRLRETIPLAWMIAPFVRTPGNIMKRYFADNPVTGALFKANRDALRKGGHAADQVIGRWMVSSALMWAAWEAAGRPGDPRTGDQGERGILSGTPDPNRVAAGTERLDHPDYSLRIGDKWYQFNGLDNVGTLLGTVADIKGISNYIDRGRSDMDPNVLVKAATMAARSVAMNLMDKSYFSGAMGLMNALNDPARYGASVGNRYAASVVPAIVNSFAQMNDPYLRDARSVMDAIGARSVLSRKDLPPQVNIFGEAVRAPGGAGWSPVPAYPDRQDPVLDEVIRVGRPIDRVDDYLRIGSQNIPMDREQYYMYATIQGRVLRSSLENLIGSARYAAMDDDRRRDAISRAVRSARKRARWYAIDVIPGLKQAIRPANLRALRAHTTRYLPPDMMEEGAQ